MKNNLFPSLSVKVGKYISNKLKIMNLLNGGNK